MDSKKIFIAVLMALAFNAGTAEAAYPLDGTKHDLSSRVTKTYSAKVPAEGGTTEVCIFCHTPHGSNTEAPLWNRASYVASYQVYTSDVMAALNYPLAENPNTGAAHSRTRLCLSCHDGTIALGSVVNLPNTIPSMYTEIQMAGSSKIQEAAQGYIGLNLRDDHPVAIPLKKAGGDPELLVPAMGSNIKLYDSTGAKNNADGNYVECTSCHNPHDNANGNFLVMANTGSAVCNECHTKTGFVNPSIHFTAAVAYAPPDGKGGSLSSNTFVSGVQCMNCHFPHKAGIIDTTQLPMASPNIVANTKAGYYLLTFQEEKSCFNNNDRWTNDPVGACHGINANTFNANRDIESVENNGSYKRHRTQNYVGKHEATEGKTQGWIGPASANWHVECADCHNPHTAGGTLTAGVYHPAGQNTIATTNPLYGAGGVSMPGTPRSWSGFPIGSGYTYREPWGVVNNGAYTGAQYEYEICFKCHTDFAWGSAVAPNSTTLGLPMTDQAMEFNTAAPNLSYHPVVGGNPSNQGTFLTGSPWSAAGTQTMYCSDCHTKQNGTRPFGSHGSSNAAILNKPYTDTYSTTLSQTQPTTDLCFDCHDSGTYVTGLDIPGSQVTGFFTTGGVNGVNLHTRHYILSTSSATGLYAYRCVNCHVRIPHGYKQKALIVQRNDGIPYEAGTLTGQGKIQTVNLPAAGNYQTTKATTDCATVAGCHN